MKHFALSFKYINALFLVIALSSPKAFAEDDFLDFSSDNDSKKSEKEEAELDFSAPKSETRKLQKKTQPVADDFAFDEAAFGDSGNSSESLWEPGVRGYFQQTIAPFIVEKVGPNNDNLQLFTDVFFELSAKKKDLSYKLSSELSYIFVYSKDNPRHFKNDNLAEIKEAWFAKDFGDSVSIKGGQAYLIWGMNDLVSPVNNFLMPVDLYYGPKPDLRFSYRSQTLIDFSFRPNDSFSMNLAWVPFFRGNRVSLWGSDWEPRIDLPVALFEVFSDRESQDDLIRGMAGLGEPDEDLANSSVATQLNFSLGDYELRLGGGIFFSKLSKIFVNEKTFNCLAFLSGDERAKADSCLVSAQDDTLKNPILLKYKRELAAWVQQSLVLEPFILRIENLYSPGRIYYSKNPYSYTLTDPEPAVLLPRAVSIPTLDNSFEIEWQASTEHILTFSMVTAVLMPIPKNAVIFFVDKNTARPQAKLRTEIRNTAGFSYIYKTLDGDWNWTLVNQYSIELGELIFSAQLGYKVAENHKLSLGSMIFDGPKGSNLGQYKDNDLATLQYEYSF